MTTRWAPSGSPSGGRGPDTEARLLKKFHKDIDYAEQAFPDFKRVFMLWSPVVKQAGPNARYSQLAAVENVRKALLEERGVDVQLVINEAFQERLDRLRAYAASKTEELKSPVLRLLQIEELLSQHLERKARRASGES